MCMSVAITLDWGHKGLSVIDIEYISHYWGHKGLIVIDIRLTEYISLYWGHKGLNVSVLCVLVHDGLVQKPYGQGAC